MINTWLKIEFWYFEIKKINIEDIRSCPNIMMLFAESIFINKPIDYTKCFTAKNAEIKYEK